MLQLSKRFIDPEIIISDLLQAVAAIKTTEAKYTDLRTYLSLSVQSKLPIWIQIFLRRISLFILQLLFLHLSFPFIVFREATRFASVRRSFLVHQSQRLALGTCISHVPSIVSLFHLFYSQFFLSACVIYPYNFRLGRFEHRWFARRA
jgi:hypothetical protein